MLTLPNCLMNYRQRLTFDKQFGRPLVLRPSSIAQPLPQTTHPESKPAKQMRSAMANRLYLVTNTFPLKMYADCAQAQKFSSIDLKP